MNQGVLMHADVGERSEVDDVGNHTFEKPALPQVYHAVDLFAELDRAKLAARITGRFAKLVDDIADGGSSTFKVPIRQAMIRQQANLTCRDNSEDHSRMSIFFMSAVASDWTEYRYEFFNKF